MKPIALVFSDLHLHDWKTYNTGERRTQAHITALLILGKTAKDMGIPLLQCGDILHSNGKISLNLLYTLSGLAELWKELKLPKILGISGNHDQESSNYFESQSKSSWEWLCKTFPNMFLNLDFNNYTLTSDIIVQGIPYLTYNKGLASQLTPRLEGYKRILLIHTDLHGAVETDNREVGSVEGIPENMKEFFGEYDMVLCGHIHKAQSFSSRIHIVGAPLQQRRTDMGCDMGYGIVYQGDKLKWKTVIIDDLPKFIELEPGETPPDDYNYYITTSEKTIIEKDEVDYGFSRVNSIKDKVKNYMKAIKEPSVRKKKRLIKVLEEASND